MVKGTSLPSDIDWLGDIPNHWDMRRLKYIVEFRGGGTPSKDEERFWGGDIPWVSPKDMRASLIVDSEDHITEEAVRASSTRQVPTGSVLVVVRSGILRHSIPVAIAGRPVTLNQDMKALIPRVGVESRYLRYVILGRQHALLLAWRKAGATVESIEHDLLANTVFPVPPYGEQQLIADFLDEKTAAIDALIAKKERLIDLIEEKRQAAITRAVTKGLDPDVPMKDSGVEWLGEVPAHWEVLPVRRVAHFFGGTGFPHAYQGQTEGSYPFFKVEDMNSKGNGWILTKAANYVSEAVSRELRATICPTGSVVFAKVGAALLKNRRRVLGQASIIDNNMLAAVPTGVRTKYFAHVLGLVDFGELRRPGPVPSISGGDVASIPIPIPPQSEQIAIEEHLDDLRRRNRSMVRLVSIQVERLREYRQTLISAAVSGQIDVRSRSTRTDEVLQEALS